MNCKECNINFHEDINILSTGHSYIFEKQRVSGLTRSLREFLRTHVIRYGINTKRWEPNACSIYFLYKHNNRPITRTNKKQGPIPRSVAVGLIRAKNFRCTCDAQFSYFTAIRLKFLLVGPWLAATVRRRFECKGSRLLGLRFFYDSPTIRKDWRSRGWSEIVQYALVKILLYNSNNA